MMMDPEGKELFGELCNRLKDLGLVSDAEVTPNGNESKIVSFFYNKDTQQRVIHPNVQLPVATVQFVAPKNQFVEYEVMGVSLKFYQAPFSALGLEPIWENYRQYRTELKSSQNSLYYNYIFVDPYTREHVYQYIDAIFTSLHKEFSINYTQTNKDLVLV